MFRLSCFHMSNMSAKQRKTVQISSEPLQNTTEDCLETQDLNSHSSPLVSDSSNTMVEQRFVENFDDHDEETESKYSIDRDILVGITKSCLLGSFSGRNQSDNDIAYEDDLKKSYSVGSRDICSTPVLTVGEDLGGLHSQFPENFEVVNHGSFSTVGHAQELENSGHGDRDASDCFQWDDLSSKDFTKKRIEEWVIDIQQCSHFEELSDLSAPEIIEIEKHGNSLDISYARKEDSKVNSPGMEAAMKYISSLTANASSAQLINQGLVTIPFLSPFSSLRALNLSGNAIVRITAGALPRGLHVLNLSKNNIATIEGLRDLIRLRVLDLSYNRILRIGHGLACCSSLKELYLGVNKISEVEGLHRLLKLNILDLRFNKISTTKCLGQLTSNYLSLQVINLEGNPSQRNVGDEQLKKYLLGLLPHLACFNKQPIKTGNPKDTVQRSARITGNPKDTVQRSARIGINGRHHQNKAGSGSLSSHGHRSQQIASTSSTTKPK